MKTTAAILRKLNHPLSIEEIEIPPLRKGQVLVKILYSGLCRSQLNEIDGKRGDDRWLPHTLGHEGFGKVIELGPGVTRVKPDDDVILTWIACSGSGAEPIYYESSEGRVNSGPISTFSEYAVIAENKMLKAVIDVVPARAIPLLGCALPTGAGIVMNTLNVSAGESVVIVGCGGVGSGAILAALSSGAKNVIAVDINDRKLEFAKKLGATHAINSDKDDLLNCIERITGSKLADYVVEAAGSVGAVETALKLIHNNGIVVVAGNPPVGSRVNIDPYDLIKGKKILGSWGGDTDPEKDICRYINIYKAGKMDFPQMVTGEYTLSSLNEALNDMRAGEIDGRCIIRMGQGES